MGGGGAGPATAGPLLQALQLLAGRARQRHQLGGGADQVGFAEVAAVAEGLVHGFDHHLPIAAQKLLHFGRRLFIPINLAGLKCGGGGRGMRVIQRADDLAQLFSLCTQEAQAAFGDGSLYLEKYLVDTHHVEVQIAVDKAGTALHFGERDCSIQRRHQKLLEEAPSVAINADLRRQMGDAAVAAARTIGYEGAGTVEFLVDRGGNFYFMEMNTRIQVEHPVTEMATGVDLIAEQLRIAGGEPISVSQEQIKLTGHAIEVRINAEDPRQNFRPAPGKITGWLPPGGPGVRFDSHVYTGYEIPPFYDSLIGKLIVWGTDRNHALKRLRRALSECAVTGIPTTIDFHLQLLDRPEFQAGDVHTKFVEQDMLPPGK